MNASTKPSFAARIRRWFARPQCLSGFALEPIRARGDIATLMVTVSGCGHVAYDGARYPFLAALEPSGTALVRLQVRVGETAVICVNDALRTTRYSFDMTPTASGVDCPRLPLGTPLEPGRLLTPFLLDRVKAPVSRAIGPAVVSFVPYSAATFALELNPSRLSPLRLRRDRLSGPRVLP